MPRRNRVDPWGDLHAVAARGLFTGNRGCVVNASEEVVRHHGSTLWIICKTRYKDWRWPLARPNRWTPLFFLDDAVALAAGHRPCGLCRRDDYRQYKMAVRSALMADSGVDKPLKADDLNKALQRERLVQGRGLNRARDRILWRSRLGELPDGVVLVEDDKIPMLLHDKQLHAFSFDGWKAIRRVSDKNRIVEVLTPPVSVAALRHGFTPALHSSAKR